MQYKFVIQGRLDGLNEYTKANRGNRYAGNKMKKDNESKVFLGIITAIESGTLKGAKRYPISLRIVWYEKDARRDIDNITFATKFILDTMVHFQIIQDDSQKYVKSIQHDVLVDKENPRIEVYMDER